MLWFKRKNEKRTLEELTKLAEEYGLEIKEEGFSSEDYEEDKIIGAGQNINAAEKQMLKNAQRYRAVYISDIKYSTKPAGLNSKIDIVSAIAYFPIKPEAA